MPTIRQEISLPYNGTTDLAAVLDTNNYDGTVTYYWESAGTTALRRQGTSTDDATVSGGGTVPIRSSSFTPPGGATAYITTAVHGRIVIIQTGTITKTATNYMLSDRGWATSSATLIPLGGLWKYDSANWDGTVTFTAEAIHRIDNNMYSSTVVIEEDDGSGGGWTTKATIGTTSSVTAVRQSVAFTPTNGRTYRTSAQVSNTMGTSTGTTTRLIIVSTATPTKFESYYSHYDAIGGAGADGPGSVWEPADWSGVTNVYKYAHADGGATSESAWRNKTDSSNLVSITGAGYQLSGAVTMPGAAKSIATRFVAGTGAGFNVGIAIVAISGATPLTKSLSDDINA